VTGKIVDMVFGDTVKSGIDLGDRTTTFGSKGPPRQTTFQCGRQANWAQPFLKFVASFCVVEETMTGNGGM
jgi:hypothetical protein